MRKLILAAAIFSLSMLANAHGVDATVAVTKGAAAPEEINITSDKSVATVAKTGCITETGSRIKSKKDKRGCNGLPGRSYDKDDLDRTGATTIGEALQSLDPSVSH